MATIEAEVVNDTLANVITGERPEPEPYVGALHECFDEDVVNLLTLATGDFRFSR